MSWCPKEHDVVVVRVVEEILILVPYLMLSRLSLLSLKFRVLEEILILVPYLMLSRLSLLSLKFKLKFINSLSISFVFLYFRIFGSLC